MNGELLRDTKSDMKTSKITYGNAVEPIEKRIYTVRGQRVMLDSDLATAYGVTTKALNQAVKRNCEKFPTDFAFQLTVDETTALRSQIVTSKGRGGRRYLPYVFTEHGAIMAANVLNSKQATQMSVFVVRAFIKMRAVLSDNRELACKLAELEKKLSERLDTHEQAILHLLRQMQDLLGSAIEPEPELKKKEIGFHVREGKGRYGENRRRQSAGKSAHLKGAA
jgi:hypothetical protein